MMCFTEPFHMRLLSQINHWSPFIEIQEAITVTHKLHRITLCRKIQNKFQFSLSPYTLSVCKGLQLSVIAAAAVTPHSVTDSVFTPTN